MPTKTFFNLSEEKRQRLIDAAMKEFAHVPVNQASIANIIKYAEISRGSFYQYFEDKNDLYFYLISIFKYNSKQLMKKNFKKANGEFIEGYKRFGQEYIQAVMDSEKVGFFKNMYLYMDYQVSREVGVALVNSIRQSYQKNGERVVDVIDWDSLKIETPEERVELMKHIISMLNQAIMEGFSKEWTIEETKQCFLRRLGWIADGVRKVPTTEKRKKEDK